MCSSFYNASFFKHNDLVGVTDGRQTMSDRNYGPIPAGRQCGGQCVFGFWIKRAGRLVK
ncbi:hypothetical protein PVA19_13565 [Agrobacterium sp. CNPSo 3708]|uniref:hypothetical protein n=1 Tax=Agrobacterium sp. CNPSo 3708 TaxID=3028150 RepID=UPI002363D5B9|nr:hypothetical protein [Agrobacterium sp. CNPSo 3708]MDD1499447.1 hypothetical protein [Agrobacterium sp. CNPSo 3708]